MTDGSNHDIATFAGYLVNEDEVLECTSGGIATALARHAARMGGYVAGVRYSDDFYRAEYIVTQEEKDIARLKGSKYIQVDKADVYNKVKKLLHEGNSVLFFGLPCVVAALRKYLGRDYDNLITVELICHGPTSAEVHRQYVKHLEEKFHSKVVDFNVRKKRGSWTPPYLYAKFQNGETFWKKLYDTEYGYAFSVMGLSGCYTCRFRSDNRCGDIMLGDFWGATEEDEFWNNNGISCILVHTAKGMEFLNRIDDIRLYKTNFERIVHKNQNIIKVKEKHPKRDEFAELLSKRGLFYAVEHTKGLSVRIKSVIKKVLPGQLVTLLKKVKGRSY